ETHFTHLTVGLADLKGCIVNEIQAVNLSSLLGLVIKYKEGIPITYQLIQQTDENTYIVDGLALNLPKKTATFILDAENLTLINIGATPAIKHIKKSLIQIYSLLSRVKFIIMSDLQLDSMGGVGVLLRSCPNAQVIAPKEFIPSLVNPTFLISATRAVYGEHFTDSFEPIKPIDKQVIRGVRNKEVIELGKRSLQFLIPENETFMLTFDETRSHLYVG